MDKPHFHINREQQQRFLWYWPPIFDAGHTSTNKQSANKLVKIKKKSSSSPQRSSLKSPERKRTCWTNHSRSEDTTLSTKQLKRTALMDMPPPTHTQKRSIWREQACLLHFSPDWQHVPGEPRRSTCTLIQSDMPDLSWATRLAYRTLPGWKGHTVLCRRCQPCLALHSLPSRAWARWMLRTAERQPLNLRGSRLQNKAMTSEFGSDIWLVAPIGPSSLLCLYYNYIFTSTWYH